MNPCLDIKALQAVGAICFHLWRHLDFDTALGKCCNQDLNFLLNQGRFVARSLA